MATSTDEPVAVVAMATATDQTTPVQPRRSVAAATQHPEMFVGVYRAETKLCRTQREPDRRYQKKLRARRKAAAAAAAAAAVIYSRYQYI